jgi:hypothetical protein
VDDGAQPALNMILGSYNQDFANEFGDDVRAIVNSQSHSRCFPSTSSASAARRSRCSSPTKGGKAAFVGVGGSGTGKPADVFVVDDPIRNDDDAQSEVHRQRVWNWFTKVANTRIHNDSASLWCTPDGMKMISSVVYATPTTRCGHKDYAGIADDWTYINIPAVVEDPKLAKALGLTLESRPTSSCARSSAPSRSRRSGRSGFR